MKNKVSLNLFMVVTSMIFLILPFFVATSFSTNYNMIVKPSMWILLAIVTFILFPKYAQKWNSNRYDIRQLALIGTLIYIIVYFSSGLIIGYTRSPFDRSLMGIMKNVWMLGSVIIAQEFVRDSFFKITTKQHKWFVIIFTTVFFILLDLNIHTMGNIFSSIGAFMGFLTKNLISAVVINSFVSYLAYRDGIKAALMFQLPYNFVFLIAPVFPANVFVVLLLIETLIPLFIYLKIEKTFQRNNVFGLPHKITWAQRATRLVFISILCMFVALSMGLFPIVPIVIASNSMYPYIERGDIVIMKKTPFHEIKINDIIEYKLDNISVIHRVLEIKNTRDGKVLITKGDNNQSVDSREVTEEQVHGIIVSNIPKAGYPTLWLKEVISGNKVETSIEMGEE
jgi:signal peptidase I